MNTESSPSGSELRTNGGLAKPYVPWALSSSATIGLPNPWAVLLKDSPRTARPGIPIPGSTCCVSEPDLRHQPRSRHLTITGPPPYRQVPQTWTALAFSLASELVREVSRGRLQGFARHPEEGRAPAPRGPAERRSAFLNRSARATRSSGALSTLVSGKFPWTRRRARIQATPVGGTRPGRCPGQTDPENTSGRGPRKNHTASHCPGRRPARWHRCLLWRAGPGGRLPRRRPCGWSQRLRGSGGAGDLSPSLLRGLCDRSGREQHRGGLSPPPFEAGPLSAVSGGSGYGVWV